MRILNQRVELSHEIMLAPKTGSYDGGSFVSRLREAYVRTPRVPQETVGLCLIF